MSNEFKMTELGPLPKANWVLVRSAEKLLLNDSGVWGDDLGEGETGVEVLRSTNMQDNEWVFEDVARRHITEGQFQRYWLRHGDILITKSSGSKKHIGKAAYVDNSIEDRKCVFSNFMQRLRFNDDVCPKFAFYFIISDFGKNALLSRSTTTTGLRNLQKTDFENIFIPLPPLPEQRRIAAVLSAVQEAKQETEAVIRATKELKKSLMKHLFTYGPVPLQEAEKMPLKETEIGLVPQGWEQKELGEISDITYGVQAAVANLTDSSIGIPILTNINIRNDGVLDISTLRYYPLSENKRDRLILKKGDVLFNWRSGSPYQVGKTAIFNLNGDYTFSSFILRFRANRNFVDNEYLFRYLNYLKGLGFFTSRRSQSSVNSVFNASLAAKIPVFLPHTSDQTGIAMALSSVDRKIEAEKGKKKALEELFKTLLSNLMTGKIGVNQLEVG